MKNGINDDNNTSYHHLPHTSCTPLGPFVGLQSAPEVHFDGELWSRTKPTPVISFTFQPAWPCGGSDRGDSSPKQKDDIDNLHWLCIQWWWFRILLQQRPGLCQGRRQKQTSHINITSTVLITTWFSVGIILVCDMFIILYIYYCSSRRLTKHVHEYFQAKKNTNTPPPPPNQSKFDSFSDNIKLHFNNQLNMNS